jgi:hypothetical protein
MQFTLQSLMISFIAVASAIGAFGPWGIAVALGCIFAAACIRMAKIMETAGLGVGLVLLIALLLYLAFKPNLSKSEIDPCLLNLKQIASAIHDYEIKNGNLPPPYVAGPDGKPWHSWRVLILPYLDQKDLFNAYNFKEPWNGPHNIKLTKQMPAVFHCPNDTGTNGKAVTNYLAVVGSDTVWPIGKPISMNDIYDGYSQTILLVESANSSVNWMEPRDLSFQQVCKDDPSTNPDLFAPHKRKGGLRYKWAGWSHVAFVDGSYNSISSNFLCENFKALLTRNGGEWVNANQDKGPLYDPGYIDLLSMSEWSKIINTIIFILSIAALIFRPRGKIIKASAQEE